MATTLKITHEAKRQKLEEDIKKFLKDFENISSDSNQRSTP
jgi:hypothetical protein